MESRTSKSSLKIAAFDLDYTLLKPKSKNKFPINKDDAQLLYPKVKNGLEQLFKDGYKIVIFTNQKGIGKHITFDDIYYKVDKYLPNGKLFDIYISYQSDQYRKPMLGMFDQFMADNGPITDIFYVGDAAGRKGDFSFSDAQFAYNSGIPFYTPEQFFLQKHEQLPPIPILQAPKPLPIKKHIPPQTVIILVGPPGSGKSSIAQQLANKYPDTVIINNDTIGTPARSIKLFKDSLGTAPRIIVDNTNTTILNRSAYTELAKDHNYNVYAITVNISRDLAMHLNYYRAYTQCKPVIPTIAYNTFYKRLEPINTSEMYDQQLSYTPDLPCNIFEYSF